MLRASIEAQEAILRERIGRFFANRSRERRTLLQTLETLKGFSAPMFIFGGVIRDLMLIGPSITPRDVDLVVGAMDLNDVDAAFAKTRRRRNRFGGLHVAIHGWHFDVWPLGETWAFRHKHIEPAAFATLPQTTFLNIEAVAARLDTENWRYREIYAHGFFEALLTRTLEINCAVNPYPSLSIVRSLLMAAKLAFSIGPKLAEYICAHFDENHVDDLLDAQWQHYKRIICDAETFTHWLSAIAIQRKLSKRSAVQLPSDSRQMHLLHIDNLARTARSPFKPRSGRSLVWY
jgi:hypothetical protein